MATIRWVPAAESVAQIDTITVGGTWAQNDTVTVTIGGASMILTIGESSPTTSTVATAIKEAFNGDTFTDSANSVNQTGNNIPQHNEITATVSSNVVTLTHDTDGVPFTVTASTTSGSGTVTPATSQSATSQNDVNNGDNWSGGSVPGAADDVLVENTSVSLLYNLDQLSGTLTSLTVGPNFNGKIGLPETANGYAEYRSTYLQVHCTTVTIHGGQRKSNRIKIDTGSVQTTLIVEDAATGEQRGLGAVVWKGTNSSNSVIAVGGSLSIAPFAGESADAANIRIGGSAKAWLGRNISGTPDVDVSGTATVDADSVAIGTLDQDGATFDVRGTRAVTTVNLNRGTLRYESTGTITTANVGGRGIARLDTRKQLQSQTISTLNLNPGGNVQYVPGTLTITTLAEGSNVSRLSAS